MRGIKPLVAGAGCLLMTAPIWIALEALRTVMILEFGIIATNGVRTILLGTLMTSGSAAIAWGMYQLIPGIIKSSSEGKLRKSSLAYRAKKSGPKEVREHLMILKGTRPRLSHEIEKCLEQLDDMSSLFSRFDQLITSNEADAVSSARVGLEEIESTLCANFKWVINSIIAADDDDVFETNAFYDQCIERIERVVAANSRALDKGNEFLLEIADNISQASGDTILLDAWLETIHAQNKLSLIRTEELR